MPNDFFNQSSIATFSGCVAIVVVITNTIQSLLDIQPKWVAFAFSMLVSFMCIIFSSSFHILDFIFAFINGCAIYLASIGTSTFTNKRKKSKRKIEERESPEIRKKRNFYQSWLE